MVPVKLTVTDRDSLIESRSRPADHRPASTTASFTGTEEAITRIKAYLQLLGVTDESHLQRTAEDLLAHVAAERGTAHAPPKLSAIMTATISRLELWVDQLIAPFPPAQPDPTAHGLAFWKLRSLLPQWPDVLLKNGNLPAECRGELLRSVRAIVPGPAPAPVAPQELGDLPPLLRSAFWSHVGLRLGDLWRKTKGLVHKE